MYLEEFYNNVVLPVFNDSKFLSFFEEINYKLNPVLDFDSIEIFTRTKRCIRPSPSDIIITLKPFGSDAYEDFEPDKHQISSFVILVHEFDRRFLRYAVVSESYKICIHSLLTSPTENSSYNLGRLLLSKLDVLDSFDNFIIDLEKLRGQEVF